MSHAAQCEFGNHAVALFAHQQAECGLIEVALDALVLQRQVDGLDHGQVNALMAHFLASSAT